MLPDVDGQDAAAVEKALRAAREETSRPSLICCKTIIGFGAPDKQGTKEAHGEALGAEEVTAARQTLGWRYPPFEVPSDIEASWDHRTQGAALEGEWRALFARYRAAFPDLATQFERRIQGELPENWEDTVRQTLETLGKQSAPQATRAVLAGRAQRAGSGPAGAARRLGRPHRLEQHPASRAP